MVIKEMIFKGVALWMVGSLFFSIMETVDAAAPTMMPNVSPSWFPTISPSESPTIAPSVSTTSTPTEAPSLSPTTQAPTTPTPASSFTVPPNLSLPTLDHPGVNLNRPNVTLNVTKLLEDSHGNLATDDAIPVMDSSDSDTAFLSDFSQLVEEYVEFTYESERKGKDIEISDKNSAMKLYASNATEHRPDLAPKIARAAIQADPTQALSVTAGVVSQLVQLNDTALVSDVVKESMELVRDLDSSGSPAAYVSQKIAQEHPDLKAAVLAAVQTMAKESKQQAITSAGGTVYSTTGGVTLTIPKGAVSGTVQISLHTYDCNMVSTINIENTGTTLCHAVLPHTFNEPVSLEFNIPKDGLARKCLKATDELENNWEEVDCLITDGAVMYTSAKFSVVTTTLSGGFRYDPLPSAPLTVVETSLEMLPIPLATLPLPQRRFELMYRCESQGMFHAFLEPEHANSAILGTRSRVDIAMLGITASHGSQRLFWSDGSRIETVKIQHLEEKTPVHGAPLTVVGGSVSLQIWGHYLGEDAEDIIAVQIEQPPNGEPRDCVVDEYISPNEIVCYAAQASNKDGFAFAQVAASTINPHTVSVVTHRRAPGRMIPQVDLVHINVRARIPMALCFVQGTNTLFWSDINLNKVFRAILVNETELASTTVIAKGVSISSLEYSNEDKLLYMADQKQGNILSVSVSIDGDVDEITPATVILSGLENPRGLALDDARRHLYVSCEHGAIFRIHLSSLKMRKVLQRPTKARLGGIALSLGPGGMSKSHIFWCEIDTNRIMRATLAGTSIREVATDALWPRSLVIVEPWVYWTEYFGEIWRASAFPNEHDILEKRNVFSQVTAGKAEVKEMRANQKRGYQVHYRDNLV